MKNSEVEVIVYGKEQLCTSCIGMPSSKETFEWLKAAINQKYSNQSITISYVDINNPPHVKSIQEFSRKILEEEMFYPVVVIEEKIVGEGNPRLKLIFSELEKYGYQPS